jgi:tetraacyldisaccharide 4'-kinase
MIGRVSLARRLESEGARFFALDALASLWSRASATRVRRRLSLPSGVRVIGIGGSTLGGSGKTPLAIALARAIADRGERVTFVGHAYGARPRVGRFVDPTDDVRDVGDEALLAARDLRSVEVPVVVGPTRQIALDFAARDAASFLVVDGLLQAEPRPLYRSLLAVDGLLPWGSGRCPPSGDLRAPRDALLAATDAVVATRDDLPVRAQLDRATGAGGSEISLAGLRATAFGVVLTVARPARVLGSLARRGLHPAAILDFGDHACPTAAELARAAGRKQRVKAWLATPKCAVKLPLEIAGSPVLALDHRLELPKELVDWALSRGPLPAVFCPSSPGQKPW